MSPNADPRRRCLRIGEWPDSDRLLWEQAMSATAASFTRQGIAADLAPPTIRKAQAGYGRWLGFLQRRGWLVPIETAGERATHDRAATYLDELKSLGNRDYTIVGRFLELETALR